MAASVTKRNFALAAGILFGLVPVACAQESASEENLILNGDFEEGEDRPAHWQTIDGLSSFWAEDDAQHGRVLKFNTDIQQKQAYDWWVKIADGAAPKDAPAPLATVPPKYDTLAGLDGVWFWSDAVEIERDQEYWLTLDAKGAGPMLAWLVGYPEKPDTSFGADAGAIKQYIEKVKGTAPPNQRNRAAFLHKYVWKGQLSVPAGGEWKTFSRREKPFRPTKETPTVKYVRVLLYPFWPPGEYFVDNVRLMKFEKPQGK